MNLTSVFPELKLRSLRTGLFDFLVHLSHLDILLFLTQDPGLVEEATLLPDSPCSHTESSKVLDAFQLQNVT